jgi:phage-related protein
MAVVGEAHIIVRALTDRVAGDIQRGFSGVGTSGRKAGETMGSAFTRGFQSNANSNVFTRFSEGLRAMVPDADAARKALQSMVRTGYTVGTALTVIIGAIFSLLGGLVALGGSALGAAASLASLGTIFASLGLAMLSARIALGGVGRALSALNRQSGGGASAAADAAQREAAARRIEDAERNLAQVIESNRENLIEANNEVRDSQLELNEAIKEGQEEIQQLGFNAEEAALAEGRAALELDKARETLARTQDLPPNSRARKEAELAFQEAELRLRQAKDRSSDLNKEQDRLARTGVSGTEAVISANQRLAQAEANKARVVRDSLRSQADAERDLARAREDAASGTGGGGGGSDPFASLNAAQAEFVRNLLTLKPLLDEIKTSVSNALLPNLWIAINTLAQGLFKTVKDGLTEVATATGTAAVDFANMVVEGRNVAALSTLFSNASTIISRLGTAAGSAYGIALSLLNAAFPAAERYVNFLNTRLKSFDEYLKSDAGAAATKNFFKLSEDAAAQFGRVIDNILGGIGGIITANLGPGTGGQYLLDWLTDATQKFQDLGKAGEDGISPMSGYFSDVAVNAQKVLSSVGALLEELILLGANQSIGETFDILATGAPAVGDILRAFADAGPVFADLVVSITEISAKLADTGAIQVFFGTLDLFASTINRILENETLQNILKVTGQIFAMGAALGLIKILGTFALKAIAGALIALSGAIGAPVAIATTLNLKFRAMAAFGGPVAASFGKIGAAATKVFMGPIGIAIGIIGLLVGAFLILYNTNEEFKASMDALFARLMEIFTSFMPVLQMFAQMFMEVFQQIVAAIQPMIPPLLLVFQQLGVVIGSAFQQIMAALMPLIPVLLGAFQSILSAVLPLVTTLISQLVPAFGTLLEALIPLIGTIIAALVPVIVQLVQAFVPLITMIITSLVPVIVMLVEAFVPLITMIISSVVPIIVMLIEAFVPLVTMIIQSVVPIIVMLIEAFVPLVTMIIEAVVPIILMLVESFMPLVQMILELVIPIIADLVKSFMPIIKTILEFLIPIIGFLVQAFSFIIPIVLSVVGAIANFLMPIIKFVIEAFSNFIKFLPKIGEAFSNVWNGVINFFKGIANFMIGLVEGMVNGMINAINNFTRPFKDAISAVVGFFGGGNITFGNIPNIRLPRLAEGGVVSPRGGGTIAQIAEAGRPERVEPLDANGMSKRDKFMVDLLKSQNSAGTINITVNPSPGMDERELASAISREISFQMRRGAVA